MRRLSPYPSARLWPAISIVLILSLWLTSPLAATVIAPQEQVSFVQTLSSIEKSLSSDSDNKELKEWLKQSNDIRIRSAQCIDFVDGEVKRIQEDLDLLGEGIEGEATEVSEKRKNLNANKSQLEKEGTNCKLFLLRAEENNQKIKGIQQLRLKEELLARGPSIIELIQEGWEQPFLWYRSTTSFVLQSSGIQHLSGLMLFLLVVIALFELGLGIYVRHRVNHWLADQPTPVTFSGQLTKSAITEFSYFSPHLFTSIGVAIALYALLPKEPLQFISVVAYGLPIYFASIALVGTLLIPEEEQALLLDLPQRVTRKLARSLKTLLALTFLGYLLFATILAQSLPENAILFAREIFVTIIFVNLAVIVWLFGYLPRLARIWHIKPVLVLLLTTFLTMEWIGYRNLSSFGMRAVLGTLVLLGLVSVIKHIVDDLFNTIDAAEKLWTLQFRRLLSLPPSGTITGLTWFRLLLTLGLWCAAALGLLAIWGMSENGFMQLYETITEGFLIGSLKIIPARIAFALLVFAALLLLSGWFRSLLRTSWLAQTRMERGAREAMVTLSSYVGVAIALLIALAVAGFEFTNLAIIAGALSVGIGFGLQNIVNNFVSGLILLFERPIKTGDWIVVGTTEGYVKRISIRSTVIQTFDRSDVVVPNSDLISNQVTNWMLHDNFGRVRVPIGVAYGSDVELVKQVILAVAAEHPLVVNDDSTPPPKVLFLSFGDSSLNFELRAFISNVDKRLSVLSDINFAIDKAFRKNGIEIPFPQRDLHIKQMPRD